MSHFDKPFYDAIVDQGILGLLTPRFNAASNTFAPLTFLYPVDKSYRDKIIELLESVNPTAGVNTIQALTIRDNLTDPDDWLEKKDNIPNMLGYKVELSPSSTNKQIVLANGTEISINTSFRSTNDNVSMWDYKGTAPMPLEGKPAQFVKHAPKAPKPRKTGGNSFPNLPHKSILAKRMQDQSLCLLKSENGVESFQSANPFTSACVSLSNFLATNDKESLKTFNLMCEPNSVATFFAVVLPYTSKSVLEEQVKNWLMQTRGVCMDPNPNATWASYVKSLGSVGAELHSNFNNSKESMEGSALSTTGMSLYRNAFGEAADMRLKGDELRFLINCVMSKPNFTYVDLSQMFLDIEILYSSASSKSFFLVITRSDPVFTETTSMFVSSRCFLSIPNPSSNESTLVTFRSALNESTPIDPSTHLISDDDSYLSQTTSSPDVDFTSGLKKIMKSLSPEQRTKLLADLSSA